VDALLDCAPRFRADFFRREAELMQRLAREGQSPEVMFVGCSDSRVAPEFIIGAKQGDLFVLRNVGKRLVSVGESPELRFRQEGSEGRRAGTVWLGVRY
jgi:carbonic anhydrase